MPPRIGGARGGLQSESCENECPDQRGKRYGDKGEEKLGHVSQRRNGYFVRCEGQ
jgi:hypothetical protein